MLYTILKPIIRLCLKAFFRTIAVLGKENLEIKGPVIFVSNHPNSFLDPLLLAITDKGKFHYIAGAEWFGKGIKNYIFRHEFNMIPVVRPWLKSGKKISNDEMFDQCYKALAEGKHIIIYPEGTSITVPNIRELKTGAIRIKEGGDRYLKKIRSTWEEVKIIPVGVNYYSPREFQGDVILNIGEPIDYSHINFDDEKEQVKAMTDFTREKMAELVFHFEEEGFDEISKAVYKIYGSHLRKQFSIKKENTAGKFQIQKGILDAVCYFHRTQPQVVKDFKKEADVLLKLLGKHKLDLNFVGEYRWPIGLMVRLLIGLPFFLVGWLFNFWPLQSTRWIFEKFLKPKFATTYETGKLNPSFIASMAFILGIIVFLLWYIILSIVLGIWTGWYWLFPILLIVGYITGVYAAHYAKIAFDFYHMVLVVNRRRRKKEAYQSILEKWKSLTALLEKLQAEYVDA